jgi:hypothetical protein
MSRWFRFYDDALNDPKVQLLAGDLFKAWVNLLCLASKNGGKIPSADAAAFALRTTAAKARAIVADLAGYGLLDKVEGGYFAPHNWGSRQYKSDVSNDRVKRFRQRQANAVGNVTGNAGEAAPESEQNKTEYDDDAPRPPLISEAANKLADEVAIIVGHHPNFLPPAWCGAAYRVQSWLNGGWEREIILASVREQMAKRQGDKPERITYFEKGIARAHARQAQPLPVANVIEGETVNVVSKPENLAAAARRNAGAIVSFGERPRIPGGGKGGPHVRRLPAR